MKELLADSSLALFYAGIAVQLYHIPTGLPNDLISTRIMGSESNSEDDNLLRSPGDLDLNRPPPLRSIHNTLCTPLGWIVGIEGSVITVSELTILGLYTV